jgi:hypothetical protein
MAKASARRPPHSGRRAGGGVVKPASRRRPPEPVPVLGGRLLAAAVLLAVMLVVPFTCSRFITVEGPKPTDVSQWAIGTEADVRITLITADYNLLLCASEQAINGRHCANKSETELWPAEPGAPVDDNKARIIQPYRTYPDNKLVLVAGLWADPTMALRLHREPSTGVRTEKLARFVANCRLRFTGRLDNPKLRWQPGQQWQSEGPALVGEPISCKLTDK